MDVDTLNYGALLGTVVKHALIRFRFIMFLPS
jgi:hypothetical protein